MSCEAGALLALIAEIRAQQPADHEEAVALTLHRQELEAELAKLEGTTMAEHTHTYRGPGRLSGLYTIGRDGKPLPAYVVKGTAAHRAWIFGRKTWKP